MIKVALKLVFSVVLIVSSASCSDSLTVEEYLAQAKTSLEKNDASRAIISLKNAARIAPKNADVRFYLATSYIEQGDYFSAEKEIEKALHFGASNPFIYAKLIETKVKLHKFEEAYLVVEQAKNTPEDEFLAVLTYAGIAAIYSDDKALASDFIDRAIGVSDDSAYSTLGKAYINTAEVDSDFGAGIKVVDELLAHQPDFIEAIMLKGYLLQNTKQYQKAAEAFSEYVKIRPKEIQVHYLIAKNYINSSQFDLAEPKVNFLLNSMRNEPIARQFKAQILFQKKEYEEAKRYAELSVQQNESLKISRVIAGFSAYKLNDYEQAYQHLIKIKDDVPTDHIVHKLLIDLQLRLGYDSEALDSLRNVTNVNDMDSSLLTNASYQLLQSGKVEEAKELLKTSISLNSQNPAELAKQGLIQFQLNQSEQGINILEKALALDPELDFAENMLAATYIQAEHYDDALKMAKEWQAIDSKAARGYLLESSILLKNKQVEKAKVLLEKALTYEPNNIPALFKLALYEHEKNNITTAFSYYTKVLNQRPNHVKAVKNLVALIRENPSLTDRAITFYKGMLAMSPEDEFALFGLSYVYKANKQYDEATVTFKQLLDVSQSIKGVELALGDIYKLKGEWEKSLETYQRYLTANPQNLVAAHKIFVIYETLNKFEQALKQVEKTHHYYPNNKGLLLLKVYYQSMMNKRASAADIEDLRKSKVIRSHWLFDKVLGNIAYLEKDFEKSSAHYSSTYQKEPNEDNVVNWAKSEGLNNNLTQSVKVLESFLRSQPENVNIMVMLSSAYTKLEQMGKAETLLTQALDLSPYNLVVLNNLSLIKQDKGETNTALTLAEKAIAIMPNNAALLDTYGQALTLNKLYDEAIVVFDKALAYSPQIHMVEIMLHKAQALKDSNKKSALNDVLAMITNKEKFILTKEEVAVVDALRD